MEHKCRLCYRRNYNKNLTVVNNEPDIFTISLKLIGLRSKFHELHFAFTKINSWLLFFYEASKWPPNEKRGSKLPTTKRRCLIYFLENKDTSTCSHTPTLYIGISSKYSSIDSPVLVFFVYIFDQWSWKKTCRNKT